MKLTLINHLRHKYRPKIQPIYEQSNTWKIWQLNLYYREKYSYFFFAQTLERKCDSCEKELSQHYAMFKIKILNQTINMGHKILSLRIVWFRSFRDRKITLLIMPLSNLNDEIRKY